MRKSHTFHILVFFAPKLDEINQASLSHFRRDLTMGGTRIFELGGSEGQGVGHIRQEKFFVIGLSTEEN